MKNKIAVHTNSYHGFSLDEALEGIAAAGFKYVELTAVRGWTEHVMPEMGESGLSAVRGRLQELGLEAVGLSGHCNLMDAGRLQDFEKNIRLASYFGCGYIITSTGEAHFGKDETFTDDLLAQNIQKVVPVLKETNITMVLEVHGEYGTGESLYRVVKAVNSPYVGVNYDTANVVFYGRRLPEEEIKNCYEGVKYVHLKDKAGPMDLWDFPALGAGSLKLEEFMRFMDTKGYNGIYSIEIEYTQDFTMRDKAPGDLAVANEAVKKSFQYLKSIGRI